MSALGDHFPPEQKQQHIKKHLKPGAILYLFSTFTNPNKEKYLIVIHSDPSEWALLFVINSKIHPYISERPHLSDCQVKLCKKDYPFLSHDSYIDCSNVIDEFDLSEIKRQLELDMGRLKGAVTDATRKEILVAVNRARTISLRHKKMILQSL